MKKKLMFLICILLLICVIPKVEKCKCGGVTYTSLIYKVQKGGFDATFKYSIDILGLNIYKAPTDNINMDLR